MSSCHIKPEASKAVYRFARDIPVMSLYFRTACVLLGVVLHPGLASLQARTEGGWEQLTPDKLKTPVAVELTHNPCQPAVPESTRALKSLSLSKEDPTTLIQTLISKRLRSVVRGGPQPLVLIESRLISPGDTLLLDGDEKSSGWKLKLKAVFSDHLVWMAQGAGVDAREIVTWLDLFLRGT